LIMGDQFFGAYHPFESFEGRHPVQFKSFLNELKMTDKKYVFLSGDRHLVEVMKIDAKEFGKQSYEYTVSGMHTKMYAGSLSQSENSRRVGGFDTDPNYAIFELDKKEGKNTVRFKAYTIDEIVIDRSDTI
ncbi:MAG: hypothetical protein HON90_15205, partial [Halobacteriovoraceae bacterium]|nr:hypothetical protein [Halobacteriovoraceae bacterium]